jgi:peptidoglycan/xylan/chitin deacetylase (PgdA/CDA1 family)
VTAPPNVATDVANDAPMHVTTAAPYNARLPPETTAFARWKSRVVRDLAALAMPQSVLVTRGKSRRRSVALTFDDGPDAMTREYLDALDRLHVRATFFVVGENAARAPGALREYVMRGHELHGHGYTHEPFPKLAPVVLVDELARTQDLLPPTPSPRPLVRPPNGRVTPESIARVAAYGFTTVLWSLDSDDCRTRDPHVVAERVAPARVSHGEIVLFHELQPWTLAALPKVVSQLRDAGYELVTVTELLGY